MNPYNVVSAFEDKLAEFVGSRFAVSVDSCTNALFLCCKYLKVGKVTIPARTYMAVPCSILNAGGKVAFEDIEWRGMHQLKPYPIYDSACQLNRGQYVPGTFQCVSFTSNKPLKIGKGGMIFHDDPEADKWFRISRYIGRTGVDRMLEKPTMLGWNMYMTVEQAARGLSLSQYLQDENVLVQPYMDLSVFPVYQQ